MAVWDLEVSLLQEDGYVQEKGKINKILKHLNNENPTLETLLKNNQKTNDFLKNLGY